MLTSEEGMMLSQFRSSGSEKKRWNWEVIQRDVKSFLQGHGCKTNVMFFNICISSQQQYFGPKRTEAKAGDRVTAQKVGEVICGVLLNLTDWVFFASLTSFLPCKKSPEGKHLASSTKTQEKD